MEVKKATTGLILVGLVGLVLMSTAASASADMDLETTEDDEQLRCQPWNQVVCEVYYNICRPHALYRHIGWTGSRPPGDPRPRPPTFLGRPLHLQSISVGELPSDPRGQSADLLGRP